jgi:cytochrome c
LTNEEVYSLTAYLLYSNRIINSTLTIDKSTLPGIEMPAKKDFVEDDRRGGKEVR